MRLALLTGSTSQSLSPHIHNHWIEHYNQKGSYSILKCDPKTSLETLFDQIHDFDGLNVTIPFKQKIFPHAEKNSPIAQKIGAINTLRINNKILFGDNTDYFGVQETLINECDLSNIHHITILGNGGASQAIQHALYDLGKTDINIITRTPSPLSKNHYPWHELPKIIPQTDLLINATSLGMKGSEPLFLNLKKLPKHACVFDIVYNPLNTDLLKSAHEQKHQTIDGLIMLIHQARKSFEIWFNILPEYDVKNYNRLKDILLCL